MNLKRLAVSILLLTGCTTKYVWTDGEKDLFTVNDWRCRQEAQTIVFIATAVPVYNQQLRVIMPGGITTFPVNSMDLKGYQACMEAAGYSLLRIE